MSRRGPRSRSRDRLRALLEVGVGIVMGVAFGEIGPPFVTKITRLP